MDAESEVLREKALLLITRERELISLRNKHQKLLSWLALSQSLPELVDRRLSLAEIGAKFVGRIVAAIKLQRVYLLEIGDDGLRPFGSEQPTLPPLPAAAVARLLETRSGMLNEPEQPSERALVETLRLHRLLWYRVDFGTSKTVILVGGFDQQRAASYLPFDHEDCEHFAHAGQHFESLVRNVLLLNELAEDKLRLERFNEELEQRVRERTNDLARANREITQALSDLREKDRRLSEDLTQARAFQQSILPSLPPEGPIQFAASYRPLDMVGGDIYDVVCLAPQHYRVFMADASGHGVQASLRTIVIRSEYDRVKYTADSPESVLDELNRRLVRHYAETEMLCTGCCFDLRGDPHGACLLHYSNAAHPALLHASHRGVEEIYHDGPFLGLSSNIDLHTQTERLEQGDLVLLYSDGISDQPGPTGDLFDLASALRVGLGTKPTLSGALEDVCAQFDRFRGPVPVADDVTLILARFGR
jgi:serine phosphatase RsbU (regulator of sigma subunit)